MKKKIAFTWARMNPPTAGHQHLVSVINQIALDEGREPRLYLSHTHNSEKDPLPYEVKLEFARKAFGDIVTESDVTGIIPLLQSLQQEGFTDVVAVVGSDRTEDFDRILTKYNGKDFVFENVRVVSAGMRDPDSADVAGVSATAMREAARQGKLQTFIESAPPLLDYETRLHLYEATKNGLAVKYNFTVHANEQKDLPKGVEKCLQEKAQLSGIEYKTLREVFNRALVEKEDDHHYAFNKVNSFINGGKARHESNLLSEGIGWDVYKRLSVDTQRNMIQKLIQRAYGKPAKIKAVNYDSVRFIYGGKQYHVLFRTLKVYEIFGVATFGNRQPEIEEKLRKMIDSLPSPVAEENQLNEAKKKRSFKKFVSEKDKDKNKDTETDPKHVEAGKGGQTKIIVNPSLEDVKKIHG